MCCSMFENDWTKKIILMTLIKSISGIRGTIGGKVNEGLTPLDAVKFASAYGTWLIARNGRNKTKVVIGRDARISGEMIQNLVQYSLISMGVDVVDLGLSTTPTVEIMVQKYNANGGIIITASHNPSEWNALKLLDENGEFLDSDQGKLIVDFSENKNFKFSSVNDFALASSLSLLFFARLRAFSKS